MYSYYPNTDVTGLINYSAIILEPKISPTDSMEFVCPALQPVQMTVSDDQLMKKEIINSEVCEEKRIYYNCCKCEERCQNKDLFAYQEDRDVSYFQPICISCTKEVDDIKKISDWDDIDTDEVKKECPRCKNSKPLSLFSKNHKYCNLCLIKKKWSRFKDKCEKNYEIKIKNASSEVVECCKCLKLCKKYQSFAYIENDIRIKQFICLKCSLDVSDWYKLRDWEDETNPLKTRMCTRCKKNKSVIRFSKGNSGCDYCSLKRKRLYLLQKRKKDEIENEIVSGVVVKL